MRYIMLVAFALACLVNTASAQSPARWLTQLQQQNSQSPPEMAAIAKAKEAGIAVDRSEFQVLGLNLVEGLRLISAGTFQVGTVQVGAAARDDPFLEGVDLVGVSTDMAELKAAVDAFRGAFNARLEQRFGVRAMAIWPFGPQVFFCNGDVKSLADLKGLKVRSFTASMSTLLTELGATPVTLSFPEVYLALQRGVASCGVTSPTSANSGKWPEVTKVFLPLSVSGSVQSHMVNVAWLNSLPADKKAAFEKSMRDLEDSLWDLANKTNDEALVCSTGGDCPKGVHTKYSMALVKVSDADKAMVKKISQDKIIGEWGGRCEAGYPGCKKIWNDTIGKVRGLTLK